MRKEINEFLAKRRIEREEETDELIKKINCGKGRKGKRVVLIKHISMCPVQNHGR